MARRLVFQSSINARNNLTRLAQRQIANLYLDWSKDIEDRIKTSTNTLSRFQLQELRRQLIAESQNVSRQIENNIKNNIYTTSLAVVRNNTEWLKSIGFVPYGGLSGSFSYVPTRTVERLITGQIYKTGWSLSSRIWGDNQATMSDLYTIIAKGSAENRSIEEIARQLQKYVNPSQRLDWNFTSADGRRIYKRAVDYNAQRLARTLIQHAYQVSFIEVTENNPFVLKYQWISNGSRVCPLCQAMDGNIYEKDELPLDHPNGMCVMDIVIDPNIEQKIADWFNSPYGTYRDIDRFAQDLGFNGY